MSICDALNHTHGEFRPRMRPAALAGHSLADDPGSPRRRVLRAAAATIGMPVAVAGCAILPGPATQAVEVRVEAQDPAWAGPLDCEAANAAGSWTFAAPGTVTVRISSLLWITCKVPAGAHLIKSVTAAKVSDAAREGARRGAGVGAVTGAAGVLALAAATGGGAALVAGVTAGGAMQGAQVGSAVGAMRSGSALPTYPEVIVVRIIPATVQAPPSGEDARARQRP